MAAYLYQDPDPLRLHTTLLTTLGSSIRIRPFHGDRFNRLRTSLFPERHPLPLQRSKTTRLPDRRNNSYRPRRRPLYYLTDKVLTTSPYNIGIPMVLLGLVLIGIGFYIRYSRTKPRLVVGLEQMKLKNYILIGIAQGIAALPGVSRSGMTVSTMLLMGVKPEQAFRLSYLAYVPASLGAFFITLVLSGTQVDTAIRVVEPTGILIAIVTSALVGIVVISYLLWFTKTGRIYMIDFVLGGIALVLGIIATLFALNLPPPYLRTIR